MLIETVAIFGRKPQTRALALGLAKAEKYLVDIYAPSAEETNLYNKAARAAKLPPLSLLFSRSAHKAAWGADAVILDSIHHIVYLPEIAKAANDQAILTFTGDLSPEQARKIKEAIKGTTLDYIPSSQLKKLWPEFPFNLV